MENILQKADQIDLVYAINEPAAYGGYGRAEGGGQGQGRASPSPSTAAALACKWVKDGIISATTQQYPLLMAADGVQAIADYIKTGKKPTSIDTGEKLITDQPMPGVPSITVEEGMKLCWG